jgi:hypothetical protein
MGITVDWLMPFFLILWSVGISHVRPFFGGMARVGFSFLVYTMSTNALPPLQSPRVPPRQWQQHVRLVFRRLGLERAIPQIRLAGR